MYFLLAASAFQSHFKDEKIKTIAKREGGKEKGRDGLKVRESES